MYVYIICIRDASRRPLATGPTGGVIAWELNYEKLYTEAIHSCNNYPRIQKTTLLHYLKVCISMKLQWLKLSRRLNEKQLNFLNLKAKSLM